MVRTTVRWSVVAASCFFWEQASPARAADFNFTRIADTGTGFVSFSPPALNNGGTVAFWGKREAAGFGGIYAGNGPRLVVIADRSSKIGGGAYTYLNGNPPEGPPS